MSWGSSRGLSWQEGMFKRTMTASSRCPHCGDALAARHLLPLLHDVFRVVRV